VRSDAERIGDIANAIDAIGRYSARGRDAFLAEELIQTWMLHHLEIIGEALRSMTRSSRHASARTCIGAAAICTVVTPAC
jgi:uncharacterized protein with HEPN domain